MTINWKKAVGLTAACAMLMGAAACGSGSDNGGSNNSSGETTTVTLSVWAPQEDQDGGEDSWLSQMEAAFEKEHPEYKITWKNDVVGEDVAKDTVVADPEAAADVYMFSNDQLGDLIANNAIGELGENELAQVKEQNSEAMINSVTGTDGKVYGVPYTANTWFMYYNTAKYSEEDAKSWDTLLEKGKVTFPMTNGWNMQAWFTKAADLTFFGETGADADAGVTIDADKLTAVTKYLANMVANPNFANDDDTSGLAALQAGNADVYFSGTWNAEKVKDALGDNYGAAQLPSFNVDGTDYQMDAFAGSKAAAYNPNAENTKVAAQFAAFLGSTEAQKAHWDTRGIVPTDKSLSDYGTIPDDPAALAQMNTVNNTSIVQPTISEMGSWWDIGKAYGAALVNGETTVDNAAEKAQAFADQLASTFPVAEEDEE